MMPSSDTTLPKARRRRRRWPWIAIFAVLVIVGGGGAAYMLKGREAGQAQLRTVPVRTGDVAIMVTALGSLQPKDYVDIGTQVSGQLRTIHFEIGDLVQKGQLLAEIDPKVYTAKVEADRAKLKDLAAQLAKQRAELSLARLQHKRNQRLMASKATSEDAVETSRTAVAVAEATIASLEAQVDQAQSTLEGDEASLGYTKIYASMDGTVVSQSAVEGQTLNANQSAPIVLRIAKLDEMTVKAKVAEADIVKVRPGMRVEFTTLGMNDTRWQATVRQILPTPEIVNDVVLYSVLADVPNPDGLLMTDMTTQVFFIEKEAQGVPVVPMAALSALPASSQSERGSNKPQDQGGKSWQAKVMTEGGVIETRTVITGLSTREKAEVISGVALGERVVIPGGAEAHPAGMGRPDGPPAGGPPSGGPATAGKTQGRAG